jgi:hypothetical protein
MAAQDARHFTFENFGNSTPFGVAKFNGTEKIVNKTDQKLITVAAARDFRI